jgi:hypothetical protein
MGSAPLKAAEQACARSVVASSKRIMTLWGLAITLSMAWRHARTSSCSSRVSRRDVECLDADTSEPVAHCTGRELGSVVGKNVLGRPMLNEQVRETLEINRRTIWACVGAGGRLGARAETKLASSAARSRPNKRDAARCRVEATCETLLCT